MNNFIHSGPRIAVGISFVLLMACHTKSEKSSSDLIGPKNQKEVLLIGTFHYHNPGADVAKTKTFDVLTEVSQTQLELMSEKISNYNPSKIFVEWPFDRQIELDSLYQLYRRGTYFDNDNLSDFYKKNEIFQLGFRAALKTKLERVYAIDYRDTQFPFDSLMKVITFSKQSDLLTEIENGIKQFTTEFDTKIENGASLLDLTYYLNTEAMRKKSNRFHTEIPLKAGALENFIGPYLASEWHRRNLSIWSLAQKNVEEQDHRIVLLLGAGHISMIENYIDQSEEWKAVELKDIME